MRALCCAPWGGPHGNLEVMNGCSTLRMPATIRTAIKNSPPARVTEGRKERGGRNWWHPCSGTTHLGYEDTRKSPHLNSYRAASLAERCDKPLDMVLKFICCSFLASMSLLSSCPDDAASSSLGMSIEWRSPHRREAQLRFHLRPVPSLQRYI